MSDKRPPADQGWNAPGTCGGGYWRVVNGIYESWPPNPRNTVTMGAGLTMGAVAPSSPTGETEPISGTTSYTGVIRGADEAEARRMACYAKAIHDEAERLGVGRVMMLPEIVILARAVMAVADAEHADLTAEVEHLRTLPSLVEAHRIAARKLTRERDEAHATIERLWAQLNEATNTPHNDPEFGFDKTAALSDPGEHHTPMCRVHPDHFMPCSRCLGYGCTACDRGVQAADDRRSL